MENPIKMDDWGVPLFSETLICRYDSDPASGQPTFKLLGITDYIFSRKKWSLKFNFMIFWGWVYTLGFQIPPEKGSKYLLTRCLEA